MGAIMPRSLLSVPRYSDFWELAGGRGEPVGAAGEAEGGEKQGKREGKGGVRGEGIGGEEEGKEVCEGEGIGRG